MKDRLIEKLELILEEFAPNLLIEEEIPKAVKTAFPLDRYPRLMSDWRRALPYILVGSFATAITILSLGALTKTDDPFWRFFAIKNAVVSILAPLTILYLRRKTDLCRINSGNDDKKYWSCYIKACEGLIRSLERDRNKCSKLDEYEERCTKEYNKLIGKYEEKLKKFKEKLEEIR